MKEILGICLSLERKAAGFYGRLAEASGHPELRVFWKNMSVQEAGHIQYWIRLIELEGQGGLINVFDRPEITARELEKLSDTLDAITSTGLPDDPVQAMLLAYRLEFMMMHPAFPALFLIMDKKTGDLSRLHPEALPRVPRRRTEKEMKWNADSADRYYLIIL